MDLLQVSKALSNETRLKILRLLAEQPGSSIEIHRRYEDRYDDGKRRESIYRALNRLVTADIVEKRYDGQRSELEYSLACEAILVDLRKGDVTRVSDVER